MICLLFYSVITHFIFLRILWKSLIVVKIILNYVLRVTYMYVLKHIRESCITWRCSKVTILKRSGTIYTDIEMLKIH